MKKFLTVLLIILLLVIGYLVYTLKQTNANIPPETGNDEIVLQLEEQLSGVIKQLSGLQAENEKLKEYLSGAIDIIKTFKTENELLQTNVDKYKSLIVEDKLSNSTLSNSVSQSNNTQNIITISSNKINFRNQSHDTTNSICKRYNSEGLPNANWGTDAKFINSKLQDVWDNGQHLVVKHINEANQILSSPGLINKDRCRYSWLIDTLQNQQGSIKSYKTENGITNIGIDFVSYQDDISKIQRDGLGLNNMKNTSTKIRYYKLSSNSQLQTLNLDNRGYVLGYKYIGDFNTWLNEHCNNNPIYNGEKRYEEKYENGVRTRAGYTEEINRKEANGINHFCVKNRLKERYGPFNFQFDSNGDLQKIDLNWRHLSTAG